MTETIPVLKKYKVNFTQVPNEVLENPNLSLKAKGLYAYLFSKPDGWQFFISVLAKDLQESHPQVRKIVKELIDNGYIIRKQFNENGKFGGIIYEFVDIENTDNGKNRIRKIPYTQNTAYGETLNQNNIYNNNNNNNINNTDISQKPKKKDFTPPTIDECKEYAKELHCKKELGIDFYNYYNLSNWIDGKGKQILRWKQKMYQWYMHDKEKYYNDIPDKPNCPSMEEYMKFQNR